MIRYYSATVADNQDPDQLGRLSLVIPGYSGDEQPHPEWVRPRVAAGAAPGAGWWWIPPVDAIVVVEVDGAGELRWTGAEWGDQHAPPEFLAANYARRAGFTSPAGSVTLALDEDDGVIVLVENGGRVEFTRDPLLLTTLEPYVLGDTFLADLSATLAGIAATLSGLGFVQPDALAQVVKIGLSRAVGAPYLSTLTWSE